MTDQSESEDSITNSYEIKNLTDKIGNLDLKKDTFINLKADNPNIT